MSLSAGNRDNLAVIKIIAIYAFVGGFWIYCSDSILGWLVHDPALMTFLAITKGMLFILTTAALLYVLISRHVRKTTEISAMLQEKDTFLRGVASNTPGCIYQFFSGDAGRKEATYVSEKAAEIFGLSPDTEDFFQAFTDRIPEDDRALFLESIRKALAEESQWHFEGRFVRPDGKLLWFLGNSIPRKVQGGLLHNGLLLDITDRKHAEIALQESEQRFRALAENSVDTIMRFDREHRNLYVNPMAEAEMGIKAGDFIGKTHREVGFPEDLCLLLEEGIDRVFRTGEVHGLEFMLPRGIWVDCLLAPETDTRGDVVGVITSSRDITERKRAEDELRREKEFSETLVQSSPAFFVAISAEGKTIMMNDSLLNALGYSREEITGMDYLENFVPEPDRESLSEVFRDITFQKRPTVNENRVMARDGSMLLVEWHGRPIVGDTGELEYFFGVGADITERRRAEEARKRLEGQLAQAQKMESIGTLAAGIAHDFNNILSAIIGYSELALGDLSEPERAAKEIREVLKASDRARDLVSQILTFSRKKELSYSPLSLPIVIKESLKMLHSVIPSTVEIRQHLVKTGLVMSDPTQMHQLVMNLCTNAAHAMDKHGGVLTVRLEKVDIADPEAGLPAGPYLKLMVCDTGQGIDPDNLRRIFEPYFTTKELGRGTGLGLSVVHGIVKSHQGAITCRSAPGEGTVFEVFLPEIELAKEMPITRGEEPLPAGTEKILVADDEPALVELMRTILGKLGYQVTATTSSVDAYELFRSNPAGFDLIISDMTMPEMTGDTLALKIMEIRPGMPFILCTGYSEHISEAQARDLGIREFVMKPLERKELARKVREALDGA
jgi:PAS domain S-box-containing protein